MFSLHPQLARDGVVVGDFSLCRLLIMNDRQYPWFILVPRVPAVTEIHQLSGRERQQLWYESDELSRVLQRVFTPHKLNIAALGNVVPQLHLHHIVRYRHDAAWPAPIWGKSPALAYTPVELEQVMMKVCSALATAVFTRQAPGKPL